MAYTPQGYTSGIYHPGTSSSHHTWVHPSLSPHLGTSLSPAVPHGVVPPAAVPHGVVPPATPPWVHRPSCYTSLGSFS